MLGKHPLKERHRPERQQHHHDQRQQQHTGRAARACLGGGHMSLLIAFAGRIGLRSRTARPIPTALPPGRSRDRHVDGLLDTGGPSPPGCSNLGRRLCVAVDRRLGGQPNRHFDGQPAATRRSAHVPRLRHLATVEVAELRSAPPRRHQRLTRVEHRLVARLLGPRPRGPIDFLPHQPARAELGLGCQRRGGRTARVDPFALADEVANRLLVARPRQAGRRGALPWPRFRWRPASAARRRAAAG